MIVGVEQRMKRKKCHCEEVPLLRVCCEAVLFFALAPKDRQVGGR